MNPKGIRAAEINVAEGKKQARILASEANRLEQINKADGESNAILAVATAQARSIDAIGVTLKKEVSFSLLAPTYFTMSFHSLQ